MLLKFYRQFFFRAFKILQKPIAYEAKEIESEFRILEIEFPDFIISDCEHMAAFDTLNGLGSMITRCHETHLSKNISRSDFNVQCGQSVLALDAQHHFICEIAFAEHN